MPGMKRRSRSGSVRTRSSGVAPGGSGSSDPIDLEALASEEKGDEDPGLRVALHEEEESNSSVFSDEEVLNLESSDSEVSDSEAGYDPEDERILSRIRKTIEEKIAHGGEVEEDGEEASREKSIGWGRSAKSYYHDSSSDELDDDEILAESADEAKRLRSLRESKLDEEDYFKEVQADLENNLSEDSHDSVEPGPAGDESYAIASDFLYNLLPGGGSINSASRIRVDAENPRKTSDSGADSEVLRGAAGSMLYRMMPFISILPSVLEIALGSVGRSISFGSRLNFLMDRHQYKIYKLIKNLYQTCLGLPEIVKSCSKLRKLLAGYQNILGLQIFRPSPGKSNAAPNFENIQSKVSKFLQTGPTPRTEIQNDSFEELRGGSTVEAMDNSETQTAQLRGASIKAMDNSDSQPIGAEIFFSLQNGDLDCPHGSSDTDSIPDISCEEDGTEKRHIPTVYGCDYGEDPVPADTDADEGAKPKNNTFANFRPMEMKSLVKIKEGRMKKLNNGYINPANNPGKVSQDRSPSPDLDMMLYDNYKRDIKKEKKNARQIKKKKVIGRMHNLRSAYIDQYKIDNNDGKRVATSEIMKNRGLMPKRKREHRNPRIKKRMKYEKSLIKLRTIRPVARDSGSLEKYHGELTGIKSDISRSIRLS